MHKSEKTYDPLLRKAMGEIHAVMKKYDCAGYVALSSLSHFEFLLDPEATWSMLKIEKDANGDFSMRMQIKGILSSSRKNMADATCSFLYNLRDSQLLQLKTLHAFIGQIEERARITHKPGKIKNDDREMEDTWTD